MCPGTLRPRLRRPIQPASHRPAGRTESGAERVALARAPQRCLDEVAELRGREPVAFDVRDQHDASFICARLSSLGTSVSVLLVDDHALVRRGFRRLLEDDPAITVVGEASDGDTAVRLAATLDPQVIIMDWSMPGTSGVRAVQRIVTAVPTAAIVIVSVHGEARFAAEAARAGARGYVRKAIDVDLCDIVKRVANGERMFDPSLPVDSNPLPGAAAPALSERQRQVLELVCAGLLNRDIAERLGMSVNTVRVHRARLMKALGVHTAEELVAYAIRHRVVDAP